MWQTNQVSCLCGTVIPYCSKAAGRGEQTPTLVHWHDAHPAFYSQEISLERERGDKMFRHRVTECQTARNSQLVLLAPSRVTVGTQSWPGGSLTTRCGWIIRSWCRASGRQDSLSRGQFAGDTGGNRVPRLQATYTCWLNWWCMISGRPFLCRPRTGQTVNIYSVAGQAEEQSQFSLIFLWSSTGES